MKRKERQNRKREEQQIEVKVADWNWTNMGRGEDQIYECELSGLTTMQSDRIKAKIGISSLLCGEFGYRTQPQFVNATQRNILYKILTVEEVTDHWTGMVNDDFCTVKLPLNCFLACEISLSCLFFK